MACTERVKLRCEPEGEVLSGEDENLTSWLGGELRGSGKIIGKRATSVEQDDMETDPG